MSQRTADSPAEEPGTVTRLVGSDRVLAVLVALAQHPSGVTLDELARMLASPKPTVHRALASLRRARLASQDGPGYYVLGDEFLRLAFSNHEARPEHVRLQPILQDLADRFQETAHYAVLDGRSVVYRAKVDPGVGALRLVTVVGGRDPAHCTAIGKLLLSYALPDDAAVRAWVSGGPPLERRTGRTLVRAAGLVAELRRIRSQGYATEAQENEVGISSLAVPVFFTTTSVPAGAVGISALDYRTSLSSLVEALPDIIAMVDPLGHGAA